MVDFAPLEAITYQASLANLSVLAPPYDVISAEQLERLRRASPYNIAHILLGPTLTAEGWHQEAADTFRRWLGEGILQRQTAPAYWVYQQTFSLGDGRLRTRTGILGRLKLVPWGEGVYRHEHTRARAKQDRLELVRAVRANLSPVFGLYRGASLGAYLTPPVKPWLDATDEGGVRHIAWPIGEPEALSAIQQAFASQEVVIADGHHRYETALAYREERRRAEGNPPFPLPCDYVLAYLVALDDPGLCILPTHRLIGPHPPIDKRALLHDLSTQFETVPYPSLTDLLTALEGSQGPAFGCSLGEAGLWLLRVRDAESVRRRLSDHLPEELAMLDVVLLQECLLGPILGISAEDLAHGNRLSYTIDAQEAWQATREGKAEAAFFLKPTPLTQVWQAATHGVVMPQKSTYFYPKPLSGIVINPLE